MRPITVDSLGHCAEVLLVSFIICHRFWYVRYNSPYKQLFLKLKHAAGKSGEIFGSCKDVLECLLVRSRAFTSFLLLFLLQVQGRDRPRTCSAVINQCSSEGDSKPYVGERINRDFENRKFALESLEKSYFAIKSADRRTLWTLCPRMLWCAFIGARGDFPSPPPLRPPSAYPSETATTAMRKEVVTL